MNGKQLKNSILQWAIQGKLVPQDLNDEPASVLLERIRAEKERLIKEKKIKRSKNESIIYRGEDNSYYEKFADGTVKCIDEEIPFEIPTSWEWCRFGNLMINRDSERVPLSVDQRLSKEKIYDYYGASGVIDKVDDYIFDKELLLIGEDGANLINRSTPIAFLASGKYWVNNHAHVLDSCGGLLLPYVSIFINAISLVEYVTGTAQPKMNQEKMNSILVAVPSVSEQERIVNRYNDIVPIIETYNKNQLKLNKLNSEIKGLLRKSILQEAIQGKLVAQDPNDEPASVLLERIRAEKERLIKEKKIKRDKNESVIYKGDDNSYYERTNNKTYEITSEIPFEIPSNWAWSRISSVINLLSGRDLEPSKYNANAVGIPYIIGASNFSNGSIVINRWTNSPATISIKGDLLITCKGTIGEMAYNQIGDIHIARQIMATNTYLIDIEYLHIFLSFSVNELEASANSMIPGISRTTILDHLLPIPPLQEQARIIEKIHLLFDKLK